MTFRPRTLFSAVILLVVVASVATSQPPPERAWGGDQSATAGGGDDYAAAGEIPYAAAGEISGRAVGSPGPGAAAAMRGAPATMPAAGSGVGAAGDMIGFSHADGSGTQTITLVDTRKSWMAVYHVSKSGTIRLVSSRPIDADFSLQLNATSPLPEEIRRIGNR